MGRAWESGAKERSKRGNEEFYYVRLNVVIVYHLPIARAISPVCSIAMENAMFLGSGTLLKGMSCCGRGWRRVRV